MPQAATPTTITTAAAVAMSEIPPKEKWLSRKLIAAASSSARPIHPRHPPTLRRFVRSNVFISSTNNASGRKLFSRKVGAPFSFPRTLEVATNEGMLSNEYQMNNGWLANK